MSRKLKKLYLNAGQMKAGTTYLYKILRPHQQIFFPPEKEIHYLSERYGNFHILSDTLRLRKGKSLMEIANRLDRPIERYQETTQWVADYLRPPTTEYWYEDIFKGHRSDQWVTDFSNLTCTIPINGLREISNIADDVRVTYCIRDAVSRAFSHAKFHLRFDGKLHDLTRLSKGELRELLLSDNILPQSRSEEHINSLHSVFGDERLRIIRCESMWQDPERAAEAICDFLGISPLPEEIAREAVNVGPLSETNEQVMQVFEEIFGELRQRNEDLLQRHHRIVIE